jgi:hypothetical protein
VVGVPRFLYEPHGDACNVLFELPAVEFGARTLFVWNPRGEATATSHDQDLLRLAPTELERQRGYLFADALPHANWRRFLFD